MPPTPCISCGYDLTGLAADAPCPECSKPVADSIRGALSPFTEPRFLQRLSRGLLVLRMALTAQGVLVLAGEIIPINSATPLSKVMPGLIALWLASIAIACVTACSVFLVTTPPPGQRTDSTADTLRRVTRIAAALFACTSVVSAALQRELLLGAQLAPAWAIAITIPLVLIVIAHLASLLLYTRWLATGFGDHSASKTIAIFTCIVPLLQVISVHDFADVVFRLAAIFILFNFLDHIHDHVKATIDPTVLHVKRRQRRRTTPPQA